MSYLNSSIPFIVHTVTNLKPLRDYDEHDVINGFFGPNFQSGDKGILVVAQGSGWVNGWEFTEVALTNQPNVVSNYRVLTSQVAPCGSGDNAGTILGVSLRDVRQYNYLGVPYLFDPIRKAEAEVVISGEALPILTRGNILVSGNWGTGVGQWGIPAVNKGAVANDSVAGGWKVVNAGTANSIGKFLGAADADNYALFKVIL